MQIEMTPVNLEEVLDQLERFTQAQIQQKNLSFQSKLPETEDDIILYANYQRLVQVFLNIVGNAIKFTHEGGISINVAIILEKFQLHGKDLPGFAKIGIADTGIGVSLDQQHKLFESFTQIDGSRTRQFGGTGLGLTISQKMVESMGGSMSFYSLGEGLGSTVTFRIPLYQEPVLEEDWELP